MLTRTIREQIARAARRQWWVDRGPGLLEELDRAAQGLDRQRLEEAMVFIERYVQSVPDLLDAFAAAAETAGVRPDLDRLLEAAVGYWELEEDLLPDHLGLIGLADDAYFSLRLVESFAEETRARSGTDLLVVDLSRANRAMARLLGPELAARLEEMVRSTLTRAELQSAIATVSAWRTGFAVSGAPALPETTVGQPVVATAARLRTPEAAGASLTDRQIVWGNVSILALGLAVAIFTVWQLYFAYPATTEVTILGWGGISVSWLDRLRTFILGSLGVSALFAASNARTLIAHFYWPFEHLQGDEVKRFFAAPGTAVFSLAVLALFASVCLANVSVTLSLERSPAEELIVQLEDEGAAFLYSKGDDDGAGEGPWRQARLAGEGGPGVRLALRGFDAETILMLRDKYNFMTVDAVRLDRQAWRVRVTPLSLEFPAPTVLDAEERRLYLAPESLPARGSVTTTSRWHLAARKEARWNRPVFQRVIDDRGEEWGARETNRLQLFPALGTACPPAPLEDLPAINTYWEEQCQERQLLATWHGMGHSLLDDVQNVVISLRHYRVSVTFGAGSIRHPDDPSRTRLETREAIRTVARRQPGPSTRETDPERATPGSPSTDRP